jgi:hypothetical protein
MHSVLHVGPRGMLLRGALACFVGLFSASASAQGVGVPGIGMPGVGGSMGYMPPRQGPMMGGGAGGVPGQMNPRMSGGGFRPGQGAGMGAPNASRSRGAGFAGVPQNAAGFSGMANGGMIMRSGQQMSGMTRFAPGVGNVGGRR